MEFFILRKFNEIFSKFSLIIWCRNNWISFLFFYEIKRKSQIWNNIKKTSSFKSNLFDTIIK